MALQERDFEKSNRRIEAPRRNNGSKYFLVALLSVLSTLGLVAAGWWLYQRMQQENAIAPAEIPVTTASPTVSPTISPTVAPSAAVAPAPSLGIQPGQFVQPALSNKAQVELIAVRRILGAPDEVSVDMRINRLADDVVGGDLINVGGTTARNPITSETYQALDPLKRSSATVSLYQMRRGQPQEAYVVLKVPAGVNALDIYVDQTQAFKNVPIADANASPVSGTAPASPVPTIAPSPQAQAPATTVPAAPASSADIQPGQFVQPALGTKGQVELLSVKRIQDPDSRNRDVVNVQMRVRRLSADRVVGGDIITVGGTTGRNPETSETYKAVDLINRSTGTVSLFQLRPQASADAYVWLRVPENVNSIDLYVPEVQAFKNVPISK
ncbi:hypothetical protein [Coleofasciculus sp. FACHB-1120]|uniref:hypothetical protein n=1 Tax=Coleofasciculus sp. FACHB-1120 TaxID=2692783 RepID=UPI001682F273|nr:hypothetical protein [Coleofasciculus sp. FACHB-1120]MBD2741096.1 hypothetical protein [Coleofasciculus sp. FACHB-1120]